MDNIENIDVSAQWSILWDASLRPPLEMFATIISFDDVPLVYTSSTNAEPLFGFSPCMSMLTRVGEAATSQAQNQVCTQDNNDSHAIHAISEDFSTLFALEEFVAFV